MNVVDGIGKQEYDEVVEVWEVSVCVTPHFLKEEDIEYFIPLIPDTYLDAIELKCVIGKNREHTTRQKLKRTYIATQNKGISSFWGILATFSVKPCNYFRTYANSFLFEI